jgi:hypothetical protein
MPAHGKIADDGQNNNLTIVAVHAMVRHPAARSPSENLSMSRSPLAIRLGFASGLLGLAVISGLAIAQTHQGHGNHPAPAAAAKTADTPATKAFKAANDAMHKAMDIVYSGDTDTDFVRGMIPHHQGAVAMAKVILAHGRDPDLKKLAESIIADQEKEIAFMAAWLKKNGK